MPTTYHDLLELIADASEWADPFELEAIAAQLFEDFAANEPEASHPYGVSFTHGQTEWL